jgi:hypothetical protein
MERQFAPFLVDAGLSMAAGVGGGFLGRRLSLASTVELRLPDFTSQGLLPPGIHQASWSEFATRFGAGARRSQLVFNMETLLQELRRQGGERVYVGGSMVTTKPVPGDFEMTWRVSGEQLGELMQRSPILTDRLLQQETLGGQLMATYPNSPGDGVLGFLQRTRQGTPVGVVEVDLSTLPSRMSFLLRQPIHQVWDRWRFGS